MTRAGERCLLYLHGFASGPGSKKARGFREYFEPRGWSVAVPDLNPGDFRELTLGGMLARARAALEEQGERVFVAGSSLGGYLAACLAAESRAVRALVLLAPAFDLRARWGARVGPDALRAWERLGTIRVFHHGRQETVDLGYRFYEESEGYPAYPAIASTPTLIFHGSRDEVVPAETSKRFAANRSHVELRLLDDDHELVASSELLARESLVFFERHAGKE